MMMMMMIYCFSNASVSALCHTLVCAHTHSQCMLLTQPYIPFYSFINYYYLGEFYKDAFDLAPLFLFERRRIAYTPSLHPNSAHFKRLTNFLLTSSLPKLVPVISYLNTTAVNRLSFCVPRCPCAINETLWYNPLFNHKSFVRLLMAFKPSIFNHLQFSSLVPSLQMHRFLSHSRPSSADGFSSFSTVTKRSCRWSIASNILF